MSNISEIDKNFSIKTSINKDDIVFLNARSSPFRIYGVFHEDGKFRRLPEAVAKTVNEGVYALHANTAGGRLRFRTNSPYVAINAKMSGVGRMSHFALCGSAGFDLYVKNVYRASYVPPFENKEGYEGIVELGSSEMRDITINFPLYSDVDELYIGIKSDAQLLEPLPYKIEKPIVYYGTSITQGGCASRPGNSYQGFISRSLNADFINLGFSGSARGEKEIGDYVKKLTMSAFVIDYDHNAPSVQHLEATYERLFLQVREANPDLPIFLVTRPAYRFLNPDETKRFEVIKKTYDNAIARGDQNVYFVDGRTLMRIAKKEGTVDGVHPTDLGFFSMATELTKHLKKVLK